MKRIVRLTESDLARIVKRVIREQEETWSDDDEMEYAGIRSRVPKMDDYDDTDQFTDDFVQFFKDNPRYKELKYKNIKRKR